MSQLLFAQNIIAVIWDFDRTLIPGYMQSPLFKKFGIDEKTFWNESNGLSKFYKDKGLFNCSPDTLYLNHILTHVQRGIFKGLNNKMLLQLGREIEFFDGLPEFFQHLKSVIASDPAYSSLGISLEHYVVSTGLRQMIMGSRIAPFVDGVWACEFIETVAEPGYLQKNIAELLEKPANPVISGIGYVIDNTTKTRALFEINKGTNKHSELGVNSRLAHADRRIPFRNMIYIADGPSDIPAFSIVNQYGGRTFGVYKSQNMEQFVQVDRLQKEDRVQGIGEATYVTGSLTAMWILNAVTEIANQIVDEKKTAIKEKVGSTPTHILTDIGEKNLPPSRKAMAEVRNAETETSQSSEARS